MKFYVGVTNDSWFHHLAGLKPDEVNFWRPRNQNDFHSIPVGAPFLFKLHSPLNFIVGGGFFVRHTFLPIELMWQAFGESNGTPDLGTLRKRILEHRKPEELGRQIGCTILGQPFFLPREDWIPVPPCWSPNIVTGKAYDSTTGNGAKLWMEVQERLADDLVEREHLQQFLGTGPRYGNPVLVRPRLGQGGFRVLVTDAYNRRCSITGEKTLPVLEAAHIRPYADNGPHSVSNGLLLRSDWHQLFDAGYVSVSPQYRVLISRRIREEFSNGKDYYAYDGQPLKMMPEDAQDRPSREFLDWHSSIMFH